MATHPPPAQSDGQGNKRDQKGAAAWLSLLSNLSLTILKFAVGILSGSVSILAEAAHSTTDLLASTLTFYTVRTAERPPDRSHPYGHGKAESLSAFVQGLLLLGAAGYIIFEAVHKLLSHAKPERLGLGMAVMAVSAVVNVFVLRFVLRVGRQSGSQAIQAVAEDHRADIYTACGVLLGLILVRLTGLGFFDPLLALIVSLLILRTSWHLVTGAITPLMDSQLPEEEINRVRRVLDADPNVLSYHQLRTRKSGNTRLVDAHVLMDDHLTLLRSHDLTEQLEDRIREALPDTQVTIHTEPYQAERQHQQEAHDNLLPPLSSRNGH